MDAQSGRLEQAEQVQAMESGSWLVTHPRHALLYDTGPAFGPGADSGNRIIAPYLRAAGVRMGVVSNWDSRLPAVLDIPVGFNALDGD